MRQMLKNKEGKQGSLILAGISIVLSAIEVYILYHVFVAHSFMDNPGLVNGLVSVAYYLPFLAFVFGVLSLYFSGRLAFGFVRKLCLSAFRLTSAFVVIDILYLILLAIVGSQLASG